MLVILGQAALRTLLLATIVQFGLWLLRTRRPQLRLAAWTVVLGASLAMPGLQWAAPLRLPVLPDLSGTDWIEAPAPRPHAFVVDGAVPMPAEDVTTQTSTLPWLDTVYLLVGGILLVRLVVGVALSLRLLRKAIPIDAAWTAGSDIRISCDVASPVTVASVILLPPDAVAWPASLREAVLAHERAHIARRDFVMLLAAQLNRAVFWFSPLSWWLHHRLAALAELASDDQAMETTGDRTGYAEILLKMGRRPGPLVRGLAMARPATLVYRIERILAGRVETGRVSPVHQLILAVGAASLSLVAAGSRPYLAPPPQGGAFAEQTQSPRMADLILAPPAPAEGGPMPVRPAAVPHVPPQPVPVAQVAPSVPPLVRVETRPVARTTPSSPSPYPVAQRIKVERDPVAAATSRKAATLIPVASVSRAPATPDSAGRWDGPASHRMGQPPAREPPPLQRVEEPACTGVYLPRPEDPRTDGSGDYVQAKYFQEADGTPWLKLFLGVRTRATLTGVEVERRSFRTTVVTALPKGASHITGTTHGAYGSIDFECVGSKTHL